MKNFEPFKIALEELRVHAPQSPPSTIAEGFAYRTNEIQAREIVPTSCQTEYIQ